MISLKDEIAKFEKMVYNRQLNEFVTLDQQFVGDGVTMMSLIEENNFMLEELKKISNVFANYCKLNDKVYNKIVEHELNVHKEQGRLNALTASIDRKLEDGLKRIKELHEEALQENRRSAERVQCQVGPIKQQLERKVNRQEFDNKMKEFIAKYDDGQYDQEGNEVEGGEKVSQVGSDGVPVKAEVVLPPGVKKKGKVNNEDFYRFKAEIEKSIKGAEEQITQHQSGLKENKDLLVKYIPLVNKNHEGVTNHTSQIYRLQAEQKEQEEYIKNAVGNLQSELNSRTNDHAWKVKFEQYHQSQARPLVNLVQQRVARNQKQAQKQYQETQSTLKTCTKDIGEIKKQIEEINWGLESTKDDLQQTNQLIELNHQEARQEYENIDRKIERQGIDMKDSLTKSQDILMQKILSVQTELSSISETVEATVMKGVSKQVEVQLKIIENEIKTNRDRIKTMNNSFGLMSQDVKNIKEILARKANYTDIIVHVEKKADKEDIKEIQTKMQENEDKFSKNFGQSVGNIKLDRPESGRRNAVSSLNRNSRTVLTPNHSHRRMEDDASTNLFMCGFDTQMGEARKNISSRRRSIKSSTAVITDFGF